MGCSSNIMSEENNEDNSNSFDKLEKIIKSYREAISKYKKSVEEYEDIFEQQIKCEKLLKNYFSLQKNIIISEQPNEIKNYKKTFNRISKLEDNLKIVPGCISKKFNNNDNENIKIKQTDDISDLDKEESENKKHANKKKKKKKQIIINNHKYIYFYSAIIFFIYNFVIINIFK